MVDATPKHSRTHVQMRPGALYTRLVDVETGLFTLICHTSLTCANIQVRSWTRNMVAELG